MSFLDTIQAVTQKAFPRTRALERELSELQGEHSSVLAALEDVRSDLTHTREQDTQQLAGLHQQLESIDAERASANAQVQALETTLADASVRQLEAEQNIRSLEARLDATRNQYEASIGSTQESLLRLQTEQQKLLGVQTGMVNTFHDVGKQLLDSFQLQASRPGLSTLQTFILSALLFLSGALVSGLVLRDTNNVTVDVTAIEQGVGDLQQLMKTHFDSHNKLLQMLTRTLSRETALLSKPGDTPAVAEKSDTAGNNVENRQLQPGPDGTGFTLTRQQVRDLAVLGFEPENKAGQSLARLRSLYLPVTKEQPAASQEEVESVLSYYAELARADGRKYQLNEQVLAAIRLGSLRTGVDFSFLMELADVESDFNPSAKSPTSNAAGLYQFRDITWLDAVHTYGSRYGLDEYASNIEYVVDSKGVMQPLIKDQAEHKALLGLRLDPRLSALLAAEHVRKNMQKLSYTLERQPGRTELYLTHFFGATGAVSFLKALDENPERIAGEIFPGPAKRNRPIFQDKSRKPRTVAEIYKLFDRKFNTSRYDETEPG